MIWTLGGIARELGVGGHRIRYAERTGKLPPPQRDWKGDRLYSEQDLERMRRIFEEMDQRKGVAR